MLRLCVATPRSLASCTARASRCCSASIRLPSSVFCSTLIYELTDDKPVVMSIPVHTTGTSKGVMKGGKLAYKQKRLNVKALPANMPSEVLLDITNLDVNQRIRVQDIACENYAILNPKSAEVVNVLSTRASATSGEGEGEAAAE